MKIPYSFGAPLCLFALLLVRSLTSRSKQRQSEASLSSPDRPAGFPDSEGALAIAHRSFLRVQEAWARRDLTTLKSEVHPALFLDWRVKLKALGPALLSQPSPVLAIQTAVLAGVEFDETNGPPCFKVHFRASWTGLRGTAAGRAPRSLILDVANGLLQGINPAGGIDPNRPISEVWTFERMRRGWVVAHIAGTEDES